MQITINTKVLLAVLGAVSKAVTAKIQTQPLLDCVLIEADKEFVRLTGTDAADSVIFTLPAVGEEASVSVGKPGIAAVNCMTILALVSTIETETVTLVMDDDKSSFILVRYTGGEATIPVFDVKDFPKVLPDGEKKRTISFVSSTLKKAIQATSYSVLEDGLRPAMAATCLDASPKETTVVATNMRRLVCYTLCDVKADAPLRFLFYPKAMSFLRSFLPDDETPVEMDIYETDDRLRTVVRIGGMSVVTASIVGKYPDWKRVIPKGNTNRLEVDRKALVSALKRVLVFSNKINSYVVMSLKGDLVGGTLEITSNDVAFSVGAKETMGVDYSGDEMTIAFSGESLTEMLQKMTSDQVDISFGKPNTAAYICPPEDEQEAFPFYGILIPVAVKG